MEDPEQDELPSSSTALDDVPPSSTEDAVDEKDRFGDEDDKNILTTTSTTAETGERIEEEGDEDDRARRPIHEEAEEDRSAVPLIPNDSKEETEETLFEKSSSGALPETEENCPPSTVTTNPSTEMSVGETDDDDQENGEGEGEEEEEEGGNNDSNNNDQTFPVKEVESNEEEPDNNIVTDDDEEEEDETETENDNQSQEEEEEDHRRRNFATDDEMSRNLLGGGISLDHDHNTGNNNNNRINRPMARSFRSQQTAQDLVLFGREKELTQLQSLKTNMTRRPVQVCFVHGVSGSGKTALCHRLKKKRTKYNNNANDELGFSNHSNDTYDTNEFYDDGQDKSKASLASKVDVDENDEEVYFCEGRFDQSNLSSKPYAALIHAFDSLGRQALRKWRRRKHDSLMNSSAMNFHLNSSNLTSGKKKRRGRKRLASQDEQSTTKERDKVEDSAATSDDEKSLQPFDLLKNSGHSGEKEFDILAVLQDALETEAGVLCDLVPSFARIMALKEREDTGTGGDMSSTTFLFRSPSWRSMDSFDENFNEPSASLGLPAPTPTPKLDDPAASWASVPNINRIGRVRRSSMMTGMTATKQTDNASVNNNSNTTPSDKYKLNQSCERLAVAFASLLKRFCGAVPGGVILFLDDLQFADGNSLAVVKGIVCLLLNDTEVRNLLLLLGHRDDGDMGGEVNLAMDWIKSHKADHLTCTDIVIQNLSRDTTHELICYLMNLEVDSKDARDLSDVVFERTEGNPFFVSQFLRIMERRRIISLTESGRLEETPRWQWDLPTVKGSSKSMGPQETQKKMTDTITDYMFQRLERIPWHCLRLLQLASFLGHQLDRSLLQNVYHMVVLKEECPIVDTHAMAFEDVIALVVGDFLLEENLSEDDSTQGDNASSSVKFPHDRLRQLIYEMIPKDSPSGSEKTQGQTHYSLGELLRDFYGETLSSPYLLLATDQLNRGIEFGCLIDDDDERIGLVRMNVLSSKVARKQSSDSLVVRFINKAASLLKPADWKNDEFYPLVLEIQNVLVEIELHQGNYQKCEEYLANIMIRARPEDRVTALDLQARHFSSILNFSEALAKSRQALELLGVHLPQPNGLNRAREIFKTRRIVSGYTDDDLTRMKQINDRKIERALVLLQDIGVYGFVGDKNTNALSLCKHLQLTMKHGLSDSASFSFGGYAQICAAAGNAKEAYRFAQLAIKVGPVDEDLEPSKVSFRHSMCLHFRSPLASSLDPLLAAYRVGLEIGDVLYGSFCLASYLNMYIICGLPLTPMVSDAKNFARQVSVLGHQQPLGIILPHLLFAMKLTGETTSPMRMSTRTMKTMGLVENENITKAFFDNKASPAYLVLSYERAWSAYILNDFSETQWAMDSILELPKQNQKFLGTHFANYMFQVLDGLICYELFARTKRRKYRAVADRALKWLKSYGSINSVSFGQLVEAKRASVMDGKEKDRVKSLFDKAIAPLVRSGYSNFGAIANEDAGRFMLRHDDEFWAREYLRSALFQYESWNATVKVNQMKRTYKVLQSTPGSSSKASGSAIRGRQRFASWVESMEKTKGSLSSRDLALGVE